MKTAILKKTRTESDVRAKVDEQLARVGIAVVGITSLAIGIWATIALISGMAASGGPGALISDWFRAVLGS